MKNFNSFVLFLFFLLIGIIGSYDVKAQVDATEHQALVDLYNQTSGTSWTNNTNWNIATNNVDNTWFGVTVFSGHVIELRLPNNSLNGTLPVSIWTDLPFLEVLDLSNTSNSNLNTFTTPQIPATVNLPLLKEINLYRSGFGGAIPSAFWSSSSLETVSFGSNNFIGNLNDIGNAIGLKSVDLSTNLLTGVFPDISGLNNLVAFNVGNNTGGNSNDFSGLVTITNNTLLRLYINKAGINDGEIELGSLPSLEELYLNENTLTDYPTGLFNPNLSSLKILSLQQNAIDDAFPSDIVNLSSLEVLNLNTNFIPFIDAAIGSLSNLTTLQISNNELTDLPDLSSLSLLTQLNVENNYLQFAPLEILTASPPSIFTYSPQKDYSVTPSIYNVVIGQNIMLSVSVSGAANNYQWYKGTSPATLISGATSFNYIIPNASAIHAGIYTCRVSNGNVTGLTLSSENITVNVVESNALNFKAGDFVEMHSDFAEPDAFDGEFTIEFWINTPMPTSNQIVMSKWNEADANEQTFKIETTTEGTLTFFTDLERITSDKVIADNDWHHVAVMRTNEGEGWSITMWVDGKEQSGYMDGSNISNSNNSLFIGKEVSTPASFVGTLDELRIWDVARSCSEIYSNIDNEIDINALSNSLDLRVYHTFNQGTAAGNNITETTLIDFSTNGRNGTVNNFDLTTSTSNWVTGSPSINGTSPNTDPKLFLLGNYVEIENGSSPSENNNTDFGIVDVTGENRFYDIRNLGINDLTISSITIDDLTGQFVIVSDATGSLNSCNYNYLEINFTPILVGIQTATITITSDDIDNPSYTFTVEGKGKPIIEVFDELSNPVSSTIDFGVIDRCDSETKIFTIQNTGFSDLTLNGNVVISGNSYFKVTAQPDLTTPIPAGGSRDFEISYIPTEETTQSAKVAIYSDDNQNPFTFEVQGTGNDPAPFSYSNYDWEQIGNTGFSPSTISNADLKIAQNGTPYIAFQDGSVGGTTSVMKYNGTSWEYVGGAGISADAAINQSLVITKDETLYVAYKKTGLDEVAIMEFDGASWTNIGTFSGKGSLQLALNVEDEPYLAFENDFGKAKVIEYNQDDNEWKNIGYDEDGFSNGQVGSISIAINIYGTPYVSFQDIESGDVIAVMEYNGFYWNPVGINIPSIKANQTSIAIDTDNSIYVAFKDTDINTVKVLKYNESWNEMGSTSLSIFSNPLVGNLLLDVAGTPYLTFSAGSAVPQDVIVVKYTISTWENIAINAGNSSEAPSSAFNTNGELYIGYKDEISGSRATVKKYIPTYSEINVQGNFIDIATNDFVPNIADSTDFENVASNKTITYTIHNTGNTDLSISSIDLNNGSKFVVSNAPTLVNPFDSATFDITFTPIEFGISTDTLTITSDNCATSIYTFSIQGTGLKSDIFVKEVVSDNEVPNGSNANLGGNTDFGDVLECNSNSVDKTFTIRNDGNADLILSTITSNATEFSVVSSLSTITSGNEGSFTITFDPSVINPQIATITITSNDPNETPYTFQVIGNGISDTEPPVATNPSTQTVDTNAGCTFDNSIATVQIPNVPATDNCGGSLTYSYTFSGATGGTTTDLTTKIFNVGTTTITYTITDVNGNATSPASFDVVVNDPIEIKVEGNFNQIDNDFQIPASTNNNTDFGDVGLSTTRTITYTIQNTGTRDLVITSINLTNTFPEFALAPITFPITIVGGDSTTFDVNFTPTTVTSYFSSVIITNNDCQNGAYQFNIQGTGAITQEIDVIGNGVSILNGDITPDLSDHTLFPPALVCGGATSIRTFTIENIGTADLTVSTISINNPDFTLANLPTFDLILPATTSHSFDVIFNPSTAGTQTAIITIDNNDANENPYTFTIQAEGINDTQAPTLIPLQNVTRNTDPTNCFYTNRTTTTTPRIPDGIASDNCRIASHRYLFSGATQGDLSSLEGVQFNKGVTTVSWTVTDENGNTSSPNQFTITIVDAQNPLIQAPSAVTTMTDLYSCVATRSSINLGIPIFSDNCAARVFNDAPLEFPLGQTTVIWTAIDSAGNTATTEQVITVREQFFVSPSDSLILVQIYNETGGQNWNRPWDLNRSVSTWAGIGITCGKVSSIDLSYNNLTGTLPNSVLNLARRTEANFALHIEGNNLVFNSVENFIGAISNFTYSPQGKIYSTIYENIRQGQSITFTSETAGNFNTYQWYKNQTLLNGAISPTLTITNARSSDAGIYVCEVKNSVATELTLERNPINLQVAGFLNATDSIALVNIYQQTGGETSWRVRWDLTQPVATWEGVTVSGEKVIELDLSEFNLTGELPNVFDAPLFSELTYLSFFNNNLEGQIPSTMGSLTSLIYLDLDKNNFEGEVPASFGNLIHLQTLWLSRNNLNKLPNEIGNLTNLKNLYLNDNKFGSLPETIGNLTELLVLNVSDNELSELPNSITNLRNLIQFYANRNFILALPTGMQNLIALTIFEFNSNKLSSLDVALLQLSSLKELRIAENQLEFDDLLPFANTPFIVFDYAPQAPINEEADILAATNSSVSFTITTQGNGNRYQWLKDGNPISTLQIFTIARVRNTNTGLYTAQITNPSLPELTLQRRSIRLNVECQAGLNFEIKHPQQTVFCKEQPFGLKLEINEGSISTSQIRWKKDGIILAFANEKTYTVTQAGTYTAEIITINGCTALSNQIEITMISQPEVAISLLNDEILESTITSQEPLTYQWLKNGNSIENAFESSYVPTETGEYSLLVLTTSGCSSVSQSILVTKTVTGIEEPKEFRNLALFPNPNNGNFFIDFGTNNPNGEPTFILIDAIGRKINLKTERLSSIRYQVKTNNLAGGIYSLQIQTKDGLAFRKFVIEE